MPVYLLALIGLVLAAGGLYAIVDVFRSNMPHAKGERASRIGLGLAGIVVGGLLVIVTMFRGLLP
jgi:hypothetical protein